MTTDKEQKEQIELPLSSEVDELRPSIEEAGNELIDQQAKTVKLIVEHAAVHLDHMLDFGDDTSAEDVVCMVLACIWEATDPWDKESGALLYYGFQKNEERKALGRKIDFNQ